MSRPDVVCRLLLIVTATLTVSTSMASPASAEPIPGNCEMIAWGFLGSQTRQICDGPTRADGSWMRRRIVGVPAHYVNPSSSCSTSRYSSNCTYYPGGWVDDRIQSDDIYPVMVDSVLPDEPGHLS